MHAAFYACVCVCAYVYICLSVCLYVCVCVRMCVCMCARIYYLVEAEGIKLPIVSSIYMYDSHMYIYIYI